MERIFERDQENNLLIEEKETLSPPVSDIIKTPTIEEKQAKSEKPTATEVTHLLDKTAERDKRPPAFYPLHRGRGTLGDLRPLATGNYGQEAIDRINQNTTTTVQHVQNLTTGALDTEAKIKAVEIRNDFLQRCNQTKLHHLQEKISIRTPLWRKAIYGFASLFPGAGGYALGTALTLGMDGGFFIGLGAAAVAWTVSYKFMTTLDTSIQRRRLDKKYEGQLQAMTLSLQTTIDTCGIYTMLNGQRVNINQHQGLGFYLSDELKIMQAENLVLDLTHSATVTDAKLLSETNTKMEDRIERNELKGPNIFRRIFC